MACFSNLHPRDCGFPSNFEEWKNRRRLTFSKRSLFIGQKFISTHPTAKWGWGWGWGWGRKLIPCLRSHQIVAHRFGDFFLRLHTCTLCTQYSTSTKLENSVIIYFVIMIGIDVLIIIFTNNTNTET
jgi:hypothetical protein